MGKQKQQQHHLKSSIVNRQRECLSGPFLIVYECRSTVLYHILGARCVSEFGIHRTQPPESPDKELEAQMLLNQVWLFTTQKSVLKRVTDVGRKEKCF